MRKLVCLLFGILLCLCFSLCFAEGGWTPPEGKTEADEASLRMTDSGECVIICDMGTLTMTNQRLYAPGHMYESDYEEPVIDAGTELVSGDEFGIKMFSWEPGENPGDGMNLTLLTNKGLGGENVRKSRIRFHAESEHYYSLYEFDATFISSKDISTTLGFDRIQVPVGREVVIDSWIDKDEIFTSPEGIYNHAGIMTPDGERFVETEDYTVRNPYITLHKPGEYPMILLVWLGINRCEVEIPVTVEGVILVGQTEPELAETEPETGETEHEVPGEGSAADDAGLTLALDQGDMEFTLYTGSGKCHLSSWDIREYETLSAAWGGEPGWSIIPADGSADVIRWSNASKDGKSIWAFYNESMKMEAGDYAATLKCDWHGQSASVTITVHVVDAPNGPLEGIAGMEESYTMMLGDTLSLNLSVLPEGWSLPDERETFRLNMIRSELDDEYSYKNNGNPLFNISMENEFGPVNITALRSGVYAVSFRYECGSFARTLETKISVQNPDGKVPVSAAEITEMEGAQWNYETEVNRQTGETYAIINGCRAAKDVTIPATVDGYPVRVIGRRAFSSGVSGDPDIIETVTIPDGVAIIDNGAFAHLQNLRSIIIPNSVILIDYNAFSECNNLTEVVLPSSLTISQIGTNAFTGTGMEDLTLGDGTSLRAESLRQDRDYISTCLDGWYYLLLEDGTVRITDRAGSNRAEELTIPETLGGHPVSELGKRLFYHDTGLRKVTLPEGLKVIGENAFRNCVNLTEINLPESLTEIGPCAFCNVGAEGLLLPEGAREQSGELWYCGKQRVDSTGCFEYGLLEDGTAVISRIVSAGKLLEIPAEVDGIPVSTIARISYESADREALAAVESVVLPESLKIIGTEAFASFEKLKKITLPEGLEVIGEEAFRGCDALKDVAFPSTLKQIGGGAFTQVPLKKLNLPEGLEVIGSEAFYGHAFTEIVIPAHVKTVGDMAFSPDYNTKLKKVSFLNPLTVPGKGVFGYTMTSSREKYGSVYETLRGYRKSLYIEEDRKSVLLDIYADQVRNSGKDALTVACYPGSEADLKYQYNVKKEYLKWGEDAIRTAPAETVLKAGLYGSDEFIYELIIPEGVEEIAEGAFSGMRTLSTVKLPSSLKVIGARAFENCGGLSAVAIPESVTAIGEGAFSGCVSLKSINLPAALEQIPADMFNGCEKLDTVKSKVKNLTAIGDRAFKNCKALAKFDLKKGLTEIGEEAFAHTALKKVQIPDTVIRIGKAAFAYSQITGITFPKTLEEIPEFVCFAAVSLKDIKFPAALKKIGATAFANTCPAALNLPEGLEEIGEGAFMYDPDRVQSYYSYYGGKQTCTKLKSLKLPASLRVIGTGAFAANDALTTLTFAKGSRLEEIGENAFALCLSLKEIVLPDSVTSIGRRAFGLCIEMKKAELGAGVTSIGAEAFIHDIELTKLKVPDSTTELGEKIIEGHGASLTVICGEGSAFETWLKTNYPDVAVSR